MEIQENIVKGAYMVLKDCPIGAKVRVMCIGTGRYDDVVCEIISKGIFVVVSYGIRTASFVPSVECVIVELPK